jgi:hypothetical protein
LDNLNFGTGGRKIITLIKAKNEKGKREIEKGARRGGSLRLGWHGNEQRIPARGKAGFVPARPAGRKMRAALGMTGEFFRFARGDEILYILA